MATLDSTSVDQSQTSFLARHRFADKDPESDEEVVAFVEGEWQVYNYYLNAMHRQWYEFLLWYYGEQYLEFNYQTKRFTVKRQQPHIPRTITNHIYPKVEVGISLFLEALPEAIVRPTTRDIGDRMASEAAGHVRRHLWRENLMEMKMRDLAGWTVITGNCFALDYLDHANKERVRIPIEEEVEEPILDEQERYIPMEDPETGEPLMQGDGITPMPLTQKRRVQRRDPETDEPMFQEVVKADVNTMIVTPFEIIPDFSARHPWEMRRFVHHRAFDINYLKSQFGKAAEDVKPESGIGLNGYYQFKILELIARSQSGGFTGFSTGAMSGGAGEFLFMENSAVLKTYFEIPDTKHPKGRIYAVANGKVLFRGPYSDLYGEKMNLSMYRYSILPGSLFGFGMVRNLIDLQRRLNGLDTQRALLRKTMGNPKWLVPIGVKFSKGLGTSEPGHVYLWRPRGNTNIKPEQLTGIPPPGDWEVERRNLLLDMSELSGIRDVLTGDNPPGVVAGIAIDLLTESAGKRFLPAINEARETLRRQELNRLRIAQKAPAWSVPRLVMVLGEDTEMEAKKFSAADFTGEYDVFIEAVTPGLFSQAQKKQNFLEAVDKGLVDLSVPSNREKGRELLGLKGFDEPMSIDMKKALYENARLMVEEPVEIDIFDDDETHIDTHMKIVKRVDFKNLPMGVQENTKAHLMQHIDQVNAELETQKQEEREEEERAARLGVRGSRGRRGGGGGGGRGGGGRPDDRSAVPPPG